MESRRLNTSYEGLELLISKRGGSVTPGVRAYLRGAYFSGAMAMIAMTKELEALPEGERQQAMEDIANEINEALS